MLVNQETFDLKSTITDDWESHHQVVIELEALANTEDWKIGVELPNDYQIDQIYGGRITQDQGKNYISGIDWNDDLNQGEKTQIILIIDEGNNANNPPIAPQLFFANAVDNLSLDNPQESIQKINFKSYIVEDWQGGYKLEADISAQSDVQGWEIDFSLPYSIREAYGVDVIDRGNGNYTINGQHSWVNLDKGQFIRPVLIIDDFNQPAIAPEASISGEQNLEVTPEIIREEPTETSEPVSSNSQNSTNSNNLKPQFGQFGRGEDLIPQPEAGGKIINVDRDFSGNLERAIAAANDGDVVRLGNNIYYTNGITIDKDITLDGRSGSIINGNNTSEAIITLNSTATGATIQDIEITNGSIGIYGYKVFDLTLQNLEVNNIGINRTIRDGQYNTGIVLNGADRLQLLNSTFNNLGRKGIGVNDTDGATIRGISVQNINLAAQHAQSFDAAGIKFFNTNKILIENSYFSDINANHIWNDTTINTSIINNVIENVGQDFLAPAFNDNVEISGIYNEKSANSIVKNNNVTALDGFAAYNATEFTTETMVLENNNFSSSEINTPDYWVNEPVERRIALTEDPDEADFSLFADEYFAQADIGS